MLFKVSILTGMCITKRCSNFEQCHSDYRHLQKWYRQRYLTYIPQQIKYILIWTIFVLRKDSILKAQAFTVDFPLTYIIHGRYSASVLHLNLVLSLGDKFLSLYQKIQCFLSQKSVSASAIVGHSELTCRCCTIVMNSFSSSSILSTRTQSVIHGRVSERDKSWVHLEKAKDL